MTPTLNVVIMIISKIIVTDNLTRCTSACYGVTKEVTSDDKRFPGRMLR